MSDVLAKICADKREWIAHCMAQHSLEEMKDRTADMPATRGFHKALKRVHSAGRKALIAEIKKASPSKGLIRPDFHPADLAEAYEAGGATCLSVLTDVPYFQGDDSFIGQVRGAAALPVLRKDFMLNAYQIYEARALGADCILIIMACLDDGKAKELHDLAYELGMDALVEVHDGEEMDRANRLNPKLLGVNNRNLKTLDISLTTFEALAGQADLNATLVAESGMYAAADLDRMARAGAEAYLIGESLMRQDDVTAATKAILGQPTGG